MNIEDYENFKINFQNSDLDENEIKKTYYMHKILTIKLQLSQTDYKTLKYFEGYYTDEEYEPIKLERQELRNQIHEYEELIKALERKEK